MRSFTVRHPDARSPAMPPRPRARPAREADHHADLVEPREVHRRDHVRIEEQPVRLLLHLHHRRRGALGEARPARGDQQIPFLQVVGAQRVRQLAAGDVAVPRRAPAARPLRSRAARSGLTMSWTSASLRSLRRSPPRRPARSRRTFHHSIIGAPRDAQGVRVRRGAHRDDAGDHHAPDALLVDEVEQVPQALRFQPQLGRLLLELPGFQRLAPELQCLLAHAAQGGYPFRRPPRQKRRR